MRGKKKGLFVVLGLTLAIAGCRIPQDARSSSRGRGTQDPGASSFAFFSGLKSFFVDEPPADTTRPVEAADLTRTDDTAPIGTIAPANASPTGIR
jgi:hypothetical protein